MRKESVVKAVVRRIFAPLACLAVVAGLVVGAPIAGPAFNQTTLAQVTGIEAPVESAEAASIGCVTSPRWTFKKLKYGLFGSRIDQQRCDYRNSMGLIIRNAWVGPEVDMGGRYYRA